MNRIDAVLEWLKNDRSEAGWGLFWATVYFVVTDLLSVDSRIRAGWRHIKDKWAERSDAQLRKRIANQERYRDVVQKYLSSERALYLQALKLVFGVLICISAGIGAIAFGFAPYPDAPGGIFLPPSRLMGDMFLGLGIVLAIQGVRLTELETKERIIELLAKLDGEIARLKARLARG
jgi:hypothetical protein